MSILCYHSVTCGWDDPVSVEPDDFEAHCAVLRSTRTVVPLAAVKGRLAAGHKLPARTAVLTFDDGFADFAEWAVPIMQRYGLPAAMYIVAGSVTEAGVPVNWITGTDASDAPPLLTTEQIRELHRQGWEIGSTAWRTATCRPSRRVSAWRTSRRARSCSRTCSAITSTRWPTPSGTTPSTCAGPLSGPATPLRWPCPRGPRSPVRSRCRGRGSIGATSDGSSSSSCSPGTHRPAGSSPRTADPGAHPPYRGNDASRNVDDPATDLLPVPPERSP